MAITHRVCGIRTPSPSGLPRFELGQPKSEAIPAASPPWEGLWPLSPYGHVRMLYDSVVPLKMERIPTKNTVPCGLTNFDTPAHSRLAQWV